MTTLLEHYSHEMNNDTRESLLVGIEGYDTDLWGLEVHKERIHLDALVFATHQTPYPTLEDYLQKRCRFDSDTNDWLVDYVRVMAATPDILPPILVHIHKDGVALIDGCHRVSALLMFSDRIRINALVVG